MKTAPTLARFLTTPENRAAVAAVHEIVAAFQAGTPQRLAFPLLLHGPSGTGKTHLASGLIHELLRGQSNLTVKQLAANEWKLLLSPRLPALVGRGTEPASDAPEPPDWLTEARAADFLVIEDVQHVPAKAVGELLQLIDDRQAHLQPTLVTARFGPRQLAQRQPRLGTRLTSRLAAGLVIALEPMQSGSRLLLLREFAQRRQLAIPSETLEWLATHLTGGGRQLEGAIAQLDTLGKLQRRPLQLADIRSHFRAQVDALRPTVERIVEFVGGHFGVDPVELRSRRRLRSILMPRQISMYLARRLTRLSLQQIGASLGGHDHTTVSHACRKIEVATKQDAVLSGTIRQLQTELM